MPRIKCDTRKEDPRYMPSSDWSELNKWAGLSKGSKVLDAGCGSFARDYIALHGMGCEVYGIDISGEAIEAAKAKLKKDGIPDRLKEGDIKNIPFPSGEFDFVYANAIPVNGTEDGWKDVCRVLKEGGKAYITLIQEATHLNPGQEKYDFSYGTNEIMGWFPPGDKEYRIGFQELQPRPGMEQTNRGMRLTKKLLVKIEKL